MSNIANHELLAAALVGYQHQLEDIHAKIAEIHAVLGKAPVGRAASPPAAGGRHKRRRISAEGRARIAAAQRERWAKARPQAGRSQPAKPKRRLSEAGRAAIIAATKKRWAAVRAAKAGAALAAKQSAKHRAPKPVPGKKAASRKVTAKPAPEAAPQTTGE